MVTDNYEQFFFHSEDGLRGWYSTNQWRRRPVEDVVVLNCRIYS